MSDKNLGSYSRRGFLCAAAVTGALPAGAPAVPRAAVVPSGDQDRLPSLKAHWIWYPERRTLPCTFVFFRKKFELPGVVSGTRAWVTGNSRYMLFVNGQFLQRGPAPCDPRTWEVDPTDLTPYLTPGNNVIGGLVCHFGYGDGTSVPGAVPTGGEGFLFQADIETSGGPVNIITDESWKTLRARCWPAGNYQRWFLRALQEEFDARLYPRGWNTVDYEDTGWREARVHGGLPGLPNLVEKPRTGWPSDSKLTLRSIPLLREEPVLPAKRGPAGRIQWKTTPEEYFDCFPTGAFTERMDDSVVAGGAAGALFPLTVTVPAGETAAVTFEFEQEICGHPFVRLRAPAGTTVEMLYVEAQEPGKLMLRTAPQFGQWARLIAKDGETAFEMFDFDALRFLQLVIRNASGPVEILEAGVKRRFYLYSHQPDLQTSEPRLNRVFGGAVNTHGITCQDTLMDNITRERQQYAGDLEHAKLASYYGFGEYRQPRRMLLTFAQGQNDEGWFLDCYPAWDRCTRLWQKHLHLTQWGPLVDHGMGFLMAAALYHQFSGDLATMRRLYPRFARFDRWLASQAGKDGLLPVTGYTWNDVWMDHFGWKTQADKLAALNIYYVGYLREGVSKLAHIAGDTALEADARRRAARVAARVRELFWSEKRRLVVDNLPRINSDGELRMHDRTLSMSLLYGIVPTGEEKPTLDLLAGLPTGDSGPYLPGPEANSVVGFSFTANACWRLWALSRYGRADAVIGDLIGRWGSMRSLIENNTFSEWWDPKRSESGNVWAQNAQVPLYVLYGDILGITPTAPAFAEFDVRPQPGPLSWIEGTVHAPSGPIHLRCERRDQGLRLVLRVPPRLRAGLVLPRALRPLGLPAEVRPEQGPLADLLRWKLPIFPDERTWNLQVTSESRR